MINEKQSKNYRDISYLYKKEDYCISDSNTFISQKIEEIIAKKEISINPNDLRDIRKEKSIKIYNYKECSGTHIKPHELIHTTIHYYSILEFSPNFFNYIITPSNYINCYWN